MKKKPAPAHTAKIMFQCVGQSSRSNRVCTIYSSVLAFVFSKSLPLRMNMYMHEQHAYLKRYISIIRGYSVEASFLNVISFWQLKFQHFTYN